MRNAYDVFLLSKKANAKKTVLKFNKLNDPLNCFLASCSIVLGKVDSLNYTKTTATDSYISLFEKIISNDSFRKKHYTKTYRTLFIKKRLKIIYNTFLNAELRKWFLKRITDKQWYKEKFIQLGFKN